MDLEIAYFVKINPSDYSPSWAQDMWNGCGCFFVDPSWLSVLLWAIRNLAIEILVILDPSLNIASINLDVRYCQLS